MNIDYKKYPTPRMRHHTAPNLYVPYNEFKVFPRYYPPIRPTIDWSLHFANNRQPNVLDIGCGRGGFLLEYALMHPEKNIFGLEVRKQAVEWIDEIIKGESIGNASVLWYNSSNGLPFVEDETVDAVFYFFPDPWHKKKHRKRRAFNPKLIEELYRTLRPDGRVYLMTDVPEVDSYQQEVLALHGGFTFDYATDEEWTLPRTDHENFSLKKGIPYIRAVVKKKGSG
jgi:tRNA (guanine-N7-)-methyltransferase